MTARSEKAKALTLTLSSGLGGCECWVRLGEGRGREAWPALRAGRGMEGGWASWAGAAGAEKTR